MGCGYWDSGSWGAGVRTWGGGGPSRLTGYCVVKAVSSAMSLRNLLLLIEVICVSQEWDRKNEAWSTFLCPEPNCKLHR